MAKMKWVQASAIMDTIAENLCHVTDYMEESTYSVEDLTEGVNTLTRDTFMKITEILGYTEVEM